MGYLKLYAMIFLFIIIFGIIGLAYKKATGNSLDLKGLFS